MHIKRTRILAVDLGTRELGVAILEGDNLLFYGVKTVQHRTTPQEVLQKITQIIKQLIDYYVPSILAIEKVLLIQKNASLLIVAADQIKAAARKEELVIYEYEPKVIRRFICQTGKATKREVAKHLARKYYELNQYLNRTSRWEQIYYAKMFDAIAVGLVCCTELAEGQKNENHSYKISSINKGQP
jgi:Holliday junction resolvasome RuvABC endonuclease subunit